MIPRSYLLAPLTLLLAPEVVGQAANTLPPSPPPVVQSLPGPLQPALAPGQQKLYGPSGDTLIARSAADGVIENFRKAYHKPDSAPRVVVCVNRAPVAKDGPAPTLADQQTVREIERLVGRVFRNAGAQLVDEQGGKDRDALAKIADIAIEILISSRNVTVPQVSGDVTYPVPDIQATAIRLKDATIVGQAAASDVIGKGIQAGRVVQQYDVRDITEATALALMEDMLTGVR